MSMENVRKFYEVLSQDTDLQQKFKEKSESLSGKWSGALEEEHLEDLFLKEILPIALEAGFEFSFQDLQEYSAESKKKSELMDEELDAVVGGNNICVCVLAGGGVFDDVMIGCSGYGGGESSTFFCICMVGGGGGLK